MPVLRIIPTSDDKFLHPTNAEPDLGLCVKPHDSDWTLQHGLQHR